MLWLTYKNFSLKNIDPDFQKQGQSAKPFNITHNILLTVETNTRPIPSVDKWVSIGQSAPGDSTSVVRKNDSYCKLRPLLLLGKKISQYLFLKASWSSGHQQALYFWVARTLANSDHFN